MFANLVFFLYDNKIKVSTTLTLHKQVKSPFVNVSPPAFTGPGRQPVPVLAARVR